MDRASLLNDPETALRTALDGFQSGLWTAIPGIIQSVDFTKMTCTVQPAVQGEVQDETGATQNVNYPLLADVPIVFPGCAGFIITLPLAQGDEVLVVFSSRCIDSWWQSGGVNNRPLEARMHDLSDGFAIPGPRSVPNIPAGSISTTGMEIRNAAGNSKIQMSADGKIRITASEVDITGDLKVTGEVTAKSGGTPIPLSTHKHTGVTTGSGTSGPPTP